MLEPHQISVAPMMGHTDRHFRYLARILAPDLRLYTPMIHADSIVYGPRKFIIEENQNQQNVAIQLAGNDPSIMSEAAAIIFKLNYDEININIGCPSSRVQNCKVGAALMNDPKLVSQCVETIMNRVDLPVSIKTRIGINNQDDYSFLYDFVAKTAQAGCNIFIIHARKAFLNGLNPKQNRTVPPIDYEKVYRLKKDFQDLTIILNGEVNSIEQIKKHLSHVNGVMIGRKAYKDPLFLTKIQNHFFRQTFDRGQQSSVQLECIKEMIDYAKRQINQKDTNPHLIVKHMAALLKGCRGAKEWRRLVSFSQHKLDNPNKALNQMLYFIENYEENLLEI
jgi:tRNA-dihydrouridine synthase A